MAEELQHLIDRIQKEAVDTGEQQAATLVSQAREKAAALVKEAEERAKNMVAKADKDAEAFTERSINTLKQAARDLLITVGQGVENVMTDIINGSVEKALKPEVIEQMLVKMSEAYFARGGTESQLEVLLSPADQQTVVKFFSEQYHQKLTSGVEIKVDNDIFKGFRVGFKGGQVYHDFTKEAIAEALANFLRPQLAEIVHRAAQTGGKAAK
ncbi:MAG: ATPase [Lentisphaerota bacterium]